MDPGMAAEVLIAMLGVLGAALTWDSQRRCGPHRHTRCQQCDQQAHGANDPPHGANDPHNDPYGDNNGSDS